MVVAGTKKVLAAVKPGTTAMVINLAEVLPGEFTRNPEFSLPTERLKRTIVALAGAAHTHFVDASRLSTALLGQSLGANMFMLGYAYQLGALPLSAQAIEKAIELNGEAVAMNHAAFRWGRRAAVDLRRRRGAGAGRARAGDRRRRCRRSFDEMVTRRVEFLDALSERRLCARAIAAGSRRRAPPRRAQAPGKCGFAEAVARYLFKLMAYKDEYEVARLYADPAFLRQVRNEVDGDNLRLDLPSRAAAVRAARQDDRRAAQDELRAVDDARVPRCWRSSSSCAAPPLDPFGYTAERRTERQLVRDYEALLDELMAGFRPTIIISPSALRRSRRRSAASVTSRCATSSPPRPTRRRFSTSSARRAAAAQGGGVTPRV